MSRSGARICRGSSEPVVAQSTSAFTRPGRMSAYSTPVQPPMDWQTMRMSPRPSWSTSAARSPAYCAGSGPPAGAVEGKKPRCEKLMQV